MVCYEIGTDVMPHPLRRIVPPVVGCEPRVRQSWDVNLCRVFGFRNSNARKHQRNSLSCSPIYPLTPSFNFPLFPAASQS